MAEIRRTPPPVTISVPNLKFFYCWYGVLGPWSGFWDQLVFFPVWLHVSDSTLRKISWFSDSRQVRIRVKYSKSQRWEALPPTIMGKKFYVLILLISASWSFLKKSENQLRIGLTPPPFRIFLKFYSFFFWTLTLGKG